MTTTHYIPACRKLTCTNCSEPELWGKGPIADIICDAVEARGGDVFKLLGARQCLGRELTNQSGGIAKRKGGGNEEAKHDVFLSILSQSKNVV